MVACLIQKEKPLQRYDFIFTRQKSINFFQWVFKRISDFVLTRGDCLLVTCLQNYMSRPKTDVGQVGHYGGRSSSTSTFSTFPKNSRPSSSMRASTSSATSGEMYFWISRKVRLRRRPSSLPPGDPLSGPQQPVGDIDMVQEVLRRGLLLKYFGDGRVEAR